MPGRKATRGNHSVNQEEIHMFDFKCQFSRLVAIFGHFRLKSNNLEDLKLDPYFPIFELFLS